MTLSITTKKRDIQTNDTQQKAEHNYAECHLQALYAECRYAEYRSAKKLIKLNLLSFSCVPDCFEAPIKIFLGK